MCCKCGVASTHSVFVCYTLQADNPLRRILNHAADAFLSHLPIVYILTVVGRRDAAEGEGGLVLR
jgi:hypothetical protein